MWQKEASDPVWTIFKKSFVLSYGEGNSLEENASRALLFPSDAIVSDGFL